MKKEINAQVKKEGTKLVAVASTGVEDRMGEIVKAEGWVLDNFLKNPVLLFAHRYDLPPIGIAKNIVVTGESLTFEPMFHDLTELAREIKSLFFAEPPIMRAFSVGFIPLEYDPKDMSIITKSELLEISAVPVPANQEALLIASKSMSPDEQVAVKGWLSEELPEEIPEEVEPEIGVKISVAEEVENIEEEMKIKGAIPFSIHGQGPKAAEDEAWTAIDEVSKATGDAKRLTVMHTWRDDEDPDFDPAVASWYKLPHHRGDGEQAVVWKGVTAAMAALMGARGGVDIPSPDTNGVYEHLASHYAQFDKTPPENKEYSGEELVEMFVKEKTIVADIVEKSKSEETYDSIKLHHIIVIPKIEIEPEEKTIEKEGRILSGKNRELINNAVDLISQCGNALQDLLNATDPVKSIGGKTTKGRSEVAQDATDKRVVRALQKIAGDISGTLSLIKSEKRKIIGKHHN